MREVGLAVSPRMALAAGTDDGRKDVGRPSPRSATRQEDRGCVVKGGCGAGGRGYGIRGVFCDVSGAGDAERDGAAGTRAALGARRGSSRGRYFIYRGISFPVPVWDILDRWIGFCGYDSIYRNETSALLGQAEAHLL